ncbi:hypothetical protein HX882_07715 [Pseudomonas gingeri]|uniref:SMI1/KNR4 family protein n=1 Tax=Pseudomonas gingeri TaxID=117681 RepID=A0A7Y7X9X7_9PSED|nr:hypothetical protein [Pseudomonas gingeri]NWB95770.1 hypothetical protein [Pseudomonas gingeri]
MANLNDIQTRYEVLNGVRPVDGEYLRQLQVALKILLPDDFIQASCFFDGSGVAVLPVHAIDWQPEMNVFSETTRLREKISLPNHFLVLGEPPASLLVMDCNEGGAVIWCDATDAPRLGKERLMSPPKVWRNYTEFLEYLIDEEELDRTSGSIDY